MIKKSLPFIIGAILSPNLYASVVDTCVIENAQIGDTFTCDGLTLIKRGTNFPLELTDARVDPNSFRETIKITNQTDNEILHSDWKFGGYDEDGQIIKKWLHLYNPYNIDDLALTTFKPAIVHLNKKASFEIGTSFTIAGNDLWDDEHDKPTGGSQVTNFDFSIKTPYIQKSNAESFNKKSYFTPYISSWEILGLNEFKRYSIESTVSFDRNISSYELLNENESSSENMIEIVADTDKGTSSDILGGNVGTFTVKASPIFTINVNNENNEKLILRIKNNTNNRLYNFPLGNGVTSYNSEHPNIKKAGIIPRDITELSIMRSVGSNRSTYNCSKKIKLEEDININFNISKSSICTSDTVISGEEILESKHNVEGYTDLLFSVTDPYGKIEPGARFSMSVNDGVSSELISIFDYMENPTYEGRALRLLNMPLASRDNINALSSMSFFVVGDTLAEPVRCSNEFGLSGRHRFVFDGLNCYQY